MPTLQRNNRMVSKNDIREIHTKIDKQGEAITKMALSVAELATTIKLMPRHEPPCVFFTGHIQDHKDIQNDIDWLKKMVYLGMGGLAVLEVVIKLVWK